MSVRLIGAISVANGVAVQDRGFQTERPMGRPGLVAENLARWEIDEIVTLCFRRHCEGPDFTTLSEVVRYSQFTPISYGGGIRSVIDALQVIEAGADRIVLDSLLWSNPDECLHIVDRIGSEAVVAAVPVCRFPTGSDRSGYRNYRYAKRRACVLPKEARDLYTNGRIWEWLVVDALGVGVSRSFPVDALDLFPQGEPRLLAWGGILPETVLEQTTLIEDSRIAGLVFGSRLSHREVGLHQVKTLVRSIAENRVGE